VGWGGVGWSGVGGDGVGWGGVGWGGVGWGGVKIIMSNDIMCHAHSHPPSHIISNILDREYCRARRREQPFRTPLRLRGRPGAATSNAPAAPRKARAANLNAPVCPRQARAAISSATTTPRQPRANTLTHFGRLCGSGPTPSGNFKLRCGSQGKVLISLRKSDGFG
jgi:hypothetical protein